jgi:putative ABC transport system substrate-binding protein
MRFTRLAALPVLALVLLATPFAAKAQPPAKVPRVAYLAGGWPSDPPHPASQAFRQGLRDLGYVEGRNIAFEYRFAEGRLDRYPDLVAELVRLPVDLIVAPGTAAAQAARKATASIPIVIVLAGNPVGDGLITSFARPGGNVTGTTSVSAEIAGKYLQLLREAVPTVSRVAVLWNSLTPPHAMHVKETEAAARTLGLTLQPVSVRRPDEIPGAFVTMSREHTDGLIVLSDPMFDGSIRERTRIVELVAKNRLPTMYSIRELVQAGGLMSYGPSQTELFRRAARYVDKILRGVKPADLPVEQPTKFEMVINLKTARALGLTIPPSVLARADEVLE